MLHYNGMAGTAICDLMCATSKTVNNMVKEIGIINEIILSPKCRILKKSSDFLTPIFKITANITQGRNYQEIS
uniref:Uncharacterized protein n=1 Tax=Romanomermis culicivorax TaxID=13658 RepID=A0A915HJ72_ROMCU